VYSWALVCQQATAALEEAPVWPVLTQEQLMEDCEGSTHGGALGYGHSPNSLWEKRVRHPHCPLHAALHFEPY
jgi:hypothetical protein